MNPSEILQAVTLSGLGDIASIVGLVVAIIGFIITIVGIGRSKTAAEQAKDAADEARLAIVRTETIASFAAAVTMMDEVKRLQRAAAWEILPDRYSHLRRTLISIGSKHPNLGAHHRTEIQSAIAQFRELENTVETYLAGNRNSISGAKLNKLVTSQIDRLDAVLNEIKSSAE